MQRRFPKKLYGQRWQIETVFSMLKRNMGASLRARRYHTQSREIRLRILTHNIMILLLQRMFYTEQDSHLFSDCHNYQVHTIPLWPRWSVEPYYTLGHSAVHRPALRPMVVLPSTGRLAVQRRPSPSGWVSCPAAVSFPAGGESRGWPRCARKTAMLC